MKNLHWQRVDCTSTFPITLQPSILAARVPGGWLVCANVSSIAFVPDPPWWRRALGWAWSRVRGGRS